MGEYRDQLLDGIRQSVERCKVMLRLQMFDDKDHVQAWLDTLQHEIDGDKDEKGLEMVLIEFDNFSAEQMTWYLDRFIASS